MRFDLSEKYQPFMKQRLAHIAPYRIVLYGGAMYSGKTRWLCADIIDRCLRYPGAQAGIIRRNMPSLKRSTLRTFLQLVDDRIIKRFNQQDNYIEFKNGSIVFFMEANEQKDPEFYKFGGVELTFLGIDEAQEVSEKALLALVPKMRFLPRGYKHIEDLPPNAIRINLTANPAPGWLKEKYVDRKNYDSIYIPATVFDNPYAPKDFAERQKRIFGYNEALFKRYILGDWSAVNEENDWQLINPQWLEDALVDAGDESEIGSEEVYLGVDVARVKDNVVMAKVVGNRLVGFDTYSGIRIPEVANVIQRKIEGEGINPANIGVDATGVGAGVIDELANRGYEVTAYFAGQKPMMDGDIVEELGSEMLEFANLRAQANWLVRKYFRDGLIEIVKDIPDIELFKNEALAINYRIVGDRKVQIEDKEKIRSRLGRSPDFWDAFVIAFFTRFINNTITKLVVL